ncbi:MAG: lysophospholipid acyltransferase family protein [Nitrospiraceae bacterium]
MSLVNWLKLSVAPPVGAAVLRGLAASIRMERRGAEVMDTYYARGTSMIFAFWHSRQLMMPFAYRGRQIHVLISQHRDGEIIARLISRFDFRAVRGSSTRGGARALRELIRVGREGKDLCVTPDGPKGPAQVAQAGAIELAKATGLPIVPVTFSCSKKNSSRAGIASSSRYRFRAVSFSGGARSKCRVMPTPSPSSGIGASWKRSSIVLPPRPTPRCDAASALRTSRLSLAA